jgi:hypothetical protein
LLKHQKKEKKKRRVSTTPGTGNCCITKLLDYPEKNNKNRRKKKGLRSLRERDLSSRLRACLGRYLEEKERKREMGIIIYLFYYRNWFLVSFLVELKIEKGHVDFLPRKDRARLFFFLFLKKEALLTSPPLSFLILRQ